MLKISILLYIYLNELFFLILLIQVTWIEHAEAEDEPVHGIFTDYVSSGMAFGARRWLAVLQRQCERLASLMARNISDIGGKNNNNNVLLYIIEVII